MSSNVNKLTELRVKNKDELMPIAVWCENMNDLKAVESLTEEYFSETVQELDMQTGVTSITFVNGAVNFPCVYHRCEETDFDPKKGKVYGWDYDLFEYSNILYNSEDIFKQEKLYNLATDLKLQIVTSDEISELFPEYFV